MNVYYFKFQKGVYNYGQNSYSIIRLCVCIVTQKEGGPTKFVHFVFVAAVPFLKSYGIKQSVVRIRLSMRQNVLYKFQL